VFECVAEFAIEVANGFIGEKCKKDKLKGIYNDKKSDNKSVYANTRLRCLGNGERKFCDIICHTGGGSTTGKVFCDGNIIGFNEEKFLTSARLCKVETCTEKITSGCSCHNGPVRRSKFCGNEDRVCVQTNPKNWKCKSSKLCNKNNDITTKCICDTNKLNREEKFCKKNQTCDFTSWTCKTTQGR
jgi:hypothetical protein